MNIKILKDNKWHDKPYQDQFNVSVDEIIEISDETRVISGRADCVSKEMADILVNSGNAEKVKESTKETKPNKAPKETKPANNKVEKKE